MVKEANLLVYGFISLSMYLLTYMYPLAIIRELIHIIGLSFI